MLNEHKMKLDELVNEHRVALKLESDQHRMAELELRKEKRVLKAQIKRQQIAHQENIIQLRKVKVQLTPNFNLIISVYIQQRAFQF